MSIIIECTQIQGHTHFKIHTYMYIGKGLKCLVIIGAHLHPYLLWEEISLSAMKPAKVIVRSIHVLLITQMQVRMEGEP